MIEEGLLSVTAVCCRKGRWRNPFQSLTTKYLSLQIFVDRTPTNRSIVIFTEISVLGEFFLC